MDDINSLALQRTTLAAERTILAYVRTALAFLIAGASLIQFFDAVSYHVVGWLLLLLGIITVLVGIHRSLRMYRNLRRSVE
jgi:putative membrane protein